LLDSLIGLYQSRLRLKKWYHKIFFHLLDVAVVNVWLLYKKTNAQNGDRDSSGKKLMRLHEFKLHDASSLCCSGLNIRSENKRGRPAETNRTPKRRRICPRVADDTRTDGVCHWPKWCTSRGRCKRQGCKGTSRVICSKCKVHLCFTHNQDCFELYHGI